MRWVGHPSSLSRVIDYVYMHRVVEICFGAVEDFQVLVLAMESRKA